VIGNVILYLAAIATTCSLPVAIVRGCSSAGPRLTARITSGSFSLPPRYRTIGKRGGNAVESERG